MNWLKSLKAYLRRVWTRKIPDDEWWDVPYKGTGKDGEGSRINRGKKT